MFCTQKISVTVRVLVRMPYVWPARLAFCVHARLALIWLNTVMYLSIYLSKGIIK